MAKKSTESKPLDITKTGPQGFRQLQQANADKFTTVRPQPISLYNREAQREQEVMSPLASSPTAWGESWFDEPTATEEQFQNLGDVRAENEPWYAKVGAGLAKGVILAGTTFLDGTIGLVTGIGESINRGDISGLWDNDFSKAMQSINEWSEEALPNYYTQDELERPWYENVFSANFLGDKFIKNLGFTIGAFYSGGLEAGLIKGGGKLLTRAAMAGAKELGSAAKTINAIGKSGLGITKNVAAVVGAGTSALNEGRIEALNNSKDWFNYQKEQLDGKLQERLQAIDDEYGESPVAEQLKAQEYDDYNSALAKVSEDRTKMGNADMLMNLPILLASNIVQFGKMYANGFKTAKKGINIIGKPGEYASGSTNLGAATAITKGALSEGLEEISQKAASVSAGKYYETDVNNFYKALKDPQAEQETLDWTKALADGINETVNDGSSWEEFFIGTLTGALGMPRFRSARTSEGGWQSPVTIEGGAYNEWMEHRRNQAREEEIANYMNQRVQSPEFLNYYQGMIRHNKYQNDMNQAAANGNEFDFKNAEHAQLVSDIVMFDKAGKLGDLQEMIEAGFDTSDETLDSIVRSTTSKQEDGSLVGPFAEYAKLDSDGNIETSFGSDENKQKMIDKLTANKKDFIDTINDYRNIKDDIQFRTNEALSDDQLEELTWMKSQLKNWKKRGEDIADTLKPAFNNVINDLDALLRFNQQIMNYEGQHHADLTDKYKKADENSRAIQGALDTLRMVRDLDKSSMVSTLASNPKMVDAVIDQIDELEDSVMAQDEKEDVKSKLRDIVKLGNAAEEYAKKFKEYLTNPSKQATDHQKADEEAVQASQQAKTNDLKSKLSSATNLSEFRAALDTEDDEDLKKSTIQSLESENNELAKNYRETNQYNTEVQRAINESDGTNEAKQDALKLLQDQFNNSENVDQLANPNSIWVNNENAFDEASGGDVEESARRFLEAQYEVQRAMSKVNNDNKFKDRFSDEYKKPVEKRTNADGSPVRGDDRGDTGDSGTSTTPTVGTSGNPAVETPIGNVTKEMVAEENKSTNAAVEQPTRPQAGETRRYYRPSIPELHIEASKEGNFKPFKDVVKEREKGVDFDDIYNYLYNAGAFDYVNAGNLAVDDEIGFMIDPSFNDHTIFLVDTRNNQIVGSLDESSYSTARYEGLNSLEEKVRQEFNASRKPDPNQKKVNDYLNGLSEEDKAKSKEELVAQMKEPLKLAQKYAERLFDNWKNGVSTEPTTGKFYATPKTKVSKMMVGRIPYSTEERSLANIPNVLDRVDPKTGNKVAPVFGIIKNGVLTTNGKIDDSKIIKPVDMANKEGRLYLLIPNAAGKYSPAAVRVKHFNNEEFNLDEATVANTPMGQDIKEGISKLATAINQDDVSSAMQELAQDLYLQDVMVSHFSARAGEGIVISKKVRKPNGSYEMVTINGKEQIKEEKHTVYFTEGTKTVEVGGLQIDSAAFDDMGVTPDMVGNPKDQAAIEKEITSILTGFNLPLQVSTRRINDGAYNNRLINSNILTSNLTSAETKGSWFTTDYFDKEGNLKSAENPASIIPEARPSGNNSGAIPGIQVGSIYVDLSTNTIRNAQGQDVTNTYSEGTRQLAFEVAWAENLYGNSTEGYNMKDNKVITPSGRVLDRGTRRYIIGAEAQTILDDIAGANATRAAKIKKAQDIKVAIYENQKKVDKSRTDGDAYYILEDDGEYHAYSRVHSRLGSNWKLSEKQETLLKSIQNSLSKQSENPIESYTNYLKSLEKQFKIDLSDYYTKTDVKSRGSIANMVRDSMTGSNSQRALTAGTAVDQVIRDFFTIKDVSKMKRPEAMTEQAYIDLVSRLQAVKSNMQKLGEEFLTDNIVLYQKYPDGTRIAGEVDILALDKDGNYKIYDVKTSRYSFHPTGNGLNLFDWTINGRKATKEQVQEYINTHFKNPFQLSSDISTFDYYTLQLSAYKNLFESQYGVPVTNLAIMPYVLNYDKDKVVGIQAEKGIPVTYNSAVNVPLYRSAAPIEADKPMSMNTKAFLTNVEVKGFVHTKADGTKIFIPEASTMGVGVIIRQGNKLVPIGYSGDIRGANVYSSPIIKLDDGAGGHFDFSKDDVLGFYFTDTTTNQKYYGFGTKLFSKLGADDTGTDWETFKDALNNKNDPQMDNKGTGNSASVAINPVNNTSLELQNPTEALTDNHHLDNNDKVGFYEKDGKIVKGYINYLGEINGQPIYIAKSPNLTKGFSKDAAPHVASNDWLVVFPNGATLPMYKNASATGENALTLDKAKSSIKAALEGNPKRVADESTKETLLTKALANNPTEVAEKASTNSPETPTVNTSNPQPSGAAAAVQAEQTANSNRSLKRTRHKLRAIDISSRPTWNSERELKWLSKVLPQMTENDRVQITKGLIQVADKGPSAWGMFNDGIITLSDIAAEGTTYHEAFHAVFNLMLSDNEREGLYKEARKRFGDMTNDELEEAMAEEFREYVQTRQNRNLGQRILDFFRNLFHKTTNWKYIQPNLTSYYRMINQGRYAEGYKLAPLNTTKKSTSFDNLSDDVRERLVKKGYTRESFDSKPEDFKDHVLKCIAF